MSHAAFHLDESFIDEDLDYYFSEARDKNDQIRPDDDICSMTPWSLHLNPAPDSGQVANFFYPLLPNLLDRIYIGISVPLFASNWGASFLLQLLKVLKPGGAIVLPVYPERQAQEKGYWSRSFLENVFLSRQRWTGFSNVNAENDGVMSLRVGRKWPNPIPSTIEWLYRQRSNLMLSNLLTKNNGDDARLMYTSLIAKVWQNYVNGAIVERIILDTFGARTPVTLHSVSDDHGLLVTDLLLSPYIKVTDGITYDISRGRAAIAANLNGYFAPHTGERHLVTVTPVADVSFQRSTNVLCLMNVFSDLDESARKPFLYEAWQRVKPKGLLIVYEDLAKKGQPLDAAGLNQMLQGLGEMQIYSSIVASKIRQDVKISHYSSFQEARLVEEKRDQKRIFRVVCKAE